MKYTVITGASSGIGLETAKKFGNLGKNLILVARREDRLVRLMEEILSKHPTLEILTKTVDLSQSKNVLALYNSLKGYDIETWINNAGFGYYHSVADQD